MEEAPDRPGTTKSAEERLAERALAGALEVCLRKLAPRYQKDDVVIVCLSGRGDKDMHTVAERMGLDFS